MLAYYQEYYREDCSLPDWDARAHARLEEETIEKKRMEILCRDFGFEMKGKKHLIVGAGTGGLAICLKNNYSAEVFGVEPNFEVYEIITLRCKENGIPTENFLKAYGEELPFSAGTFDFVHCFTVLEHVADVEKCIDEMIRVLKIDGRIIINTPNYAYPYEKHYKIYFPTFLPKVFGGLYLRFLGKKSNFYSTIQRVTERSINKILVRKENITWYRIYSSPKQDTGRARWLVNWLFFKVFVYPQQNIIILKNHN